MKPIMQNRYELSDIIGEGCIYVDKTAYFHKMISCPGSGLYFISRPRRFGKSLMISALEHIFKGNRSLFKGLAIDRTDYSWPAFPVLHFDFSNPSTSSLEDFKLDFAKRVKTVLISAGYAYDDDGLVGFNFSEALKYLAGKYKEERKKAALEKGEPFDDNDNKGVVVLIDEYDAPICHALDNPELAEAIRKEMANFYIQLKTELKYVRFLMITGISRVAKLSVFTALTTLVDLTFKDEYATMLGFTEEELTEYFDEHMRAHAETMGLSYEEYRLAFKEWYDGYRFGENNPKRVYNPVSATIALDSKAQNFKGYWSATGKASVLMNLITREDLEELDLERPLPLHDTSFEIANFAHVNTLALLYQTGYLTIHDYRYPKYYLTVPNKEVRLDFDVLYLSIMASKDKEWMEKLTDRLEAHDWQRFFEGLSAFFASRIYLPCDRVSESTFAERLLMLLEPNFRLCLREVKVAGGIADVLAENSQDIFVFETKVGMSARDAIRQIKSKDYAEAFKSRGKGVYAIGLSFDGQKKKLIEAEYETVCETPAE